jgi:hypothetical protein
MTGKDVSIIAPEDAGDAVLFGINELRGELVQQGYELGQKNATRFIRLINQKNGKPESYTISSDTPTSLTLAAQGDNGLLYACLDVAEQVAIGKNIFHTVRYTIEPELAVRGLYTFLHNPDSERDWLYNPTFWQSYADNLARYRYNRFNLIYGHQSPHLVPIYAFLLDGLDEEYPELKIKDLQPEERARNLKALQMASEAMASRGIKFFLGIWNSRPWKIVNGVWENQPTRVTGTDDLGMLTAYTRKGFTRLMELCPAIGGIQLRMNNESGIADQRFYVQALVPALKDLIGCERRITVELRNLDLFPDTIEAFRESGVDIIVSTKYFAEHQGMPYQPPVAYTNFSYESILRKDKPFPFQWHVWNLGSHRLFNWGDPEYARRFALSCHLGDGIGFEVTPQGSQKGFSQWGYVLPGDWKARSDLPVQWDFERYWFFHMAFGRMGFDVKTGNEVFLHELARRTTKEAAPELFSAYVSASQVVSYLISQRMDDSNMYVWPEMDSGGPIDHNSVAPQGEVTLFATAREYAESLRTGHPTAKLSPFDCANDLAGFANVIEKHLEKLAHLPGLDGSLEYQASRVDFAALAALSRYHAAKSRATGNLAIFYVSNDRFYLDLAEGDAQEAIKLWDELCARTEIYYYKLHFGPTGGHWRDNKPRVMYDLKRIQRVRELFDTYGIFQFGFDFGGGQVSLHPALTSAMEPEPRFKDVNIFSKYTSEKGYGWLRIAGLKMVGPNHLTNPEMWGVHRIVPGEEYDLREIDSIPLDGLTYRYVLADSPYTFQVDLPNGRYEVCLIAPEVTKRITSVNLDGKLVNLGSPIALMAKIYVEISDGRLLITLGEKGPWALAGLTVRPLFPLIGHLAPCAVHAGQDLLLTATATAPYGIQKMVVKYQSDSPARKIEMHGDGAAYQVTVPAAGLAGESLTYEIEAVSPTGEAGRFTSPEIPVVARFKAPKITSATGPTTWNPSRSLAFQVDLDNGEFAHELVLHYREADQNRNFRQAAQSGGKSGKFEFAIDPRHLDGNYEVIYYFEVRDVFGEGSFYPDPFSDARYRIIKPE